MLLRSLQSPRSILLTPLCLATTRSETSILTTLSTLSILLARLSSLLLPGFTPSSLATARSSSPQFSLNPKAISYHSHSTPPSIPSRFTLLPMQMDTYSIYGSNSPPQHYYRSTFFALTPSACSLILLSLIYALTSKPDSLGSFSSIRRHISPLTPLQAIHGSSA